MKSLLTVLLGILLMSSTAWADLLSVRVNQDSDDAEERLSDGRVDRGSSDLELGYDSSLQRVGIRFQGVTIPSGSTINSAYIQFTVDETDDKSTRVDVYGEAADNSVTYGGNDGNIGSRPKTASSVTWTIPDWDNTGEQGPDQRTPDLSDIIREIIARPGWTEGGAMAFVIEPGNSCQNSNCQRTAESRDGSSSRAPLLVIDYTPSTQVSISDASVAEGNGGTSVISLMVSLSRVSSQPVSVQYSTADAGATAGSDYVTMSGVLTIPAGQISATIAVTVNGDTAYEPDEAFTVSLSNPVNGTLGVATIATVTITNDDQPATLADYHFDECSWSGAAGEVIDSSAGNHATAMGGITTTGTTGNGQAINRVGVFSGSGHVAAPSLHDHLKGTFTISFWVNTTQAGHDTNWLAPGIAGVEQHGGVDDIFIGWLDSTGRIGLNVKNDSAFTSTTRINDGQWHHVALSREVNTGETKIYVDGSLENVRVQGAGTIGNTFSDIGRVINTNAAISPLYFTGMLDEVLIFEAMLSDADVAKIHSHQQALNNWDGTVRAPLVCSVQVLGCSDPVKHVVPKMEVASINIIDTYNKPTPTTVNFTQSFAAPPLVFTLPTVDGANSAAHRIRNITASGFQIMTVEPDGEDGEHVAMSLNFLAIEPGVYVLPDGHKLEACYVETTAAQQSRGSHDWESVSFLSGFGVTPAVLGQIQTMRNETGNLPSEPSRPWLTTAITDVHSGSMKMALERSETSAGTITQPEIIAYLASEPTNGRNTLQAATKEVEYEIIRSGEVINGWNTCQSIYYSSPWTRADGTRFRPIPLASMNTREGDTGTGGEDDGGWFRRCTNDDGNVNNASQRIRLSVDEIRTGSTNYDGNRTHNKAERAGIVVFSDNFVTNAVNLHHYEFEHPATGLTCEPAEITLKACQDAACNTLYTGNATVDLTPAGANSVWSGPNVLANQVEFSGGQVALELSQTATGTITLGASGTPTPASATVCKKDGVVADCRMSFTSGGSVFTLTPPTDALGCKAEDWTLTAESCGGTKLDGSKNVRLWFEYVDPAAPASPLAPSLNGTDLPPGDPGAGNGVNLAFTQGVATLPGMRYADAGRLRINARYEGSAATGDAGVTLNGNATTVFRPLALWVDDPSASCAAADASCAAFRKTGAPFSVAVKAVCWDAADDLDGDRIADTGTNLADNVLMPNFAMTGGTLVPELVAPVGGVNGALVDAAGAPGNDAFDATAGITLVSGLRLDEVGVFRFTASGSYLGKTIAVAPGTGTPIGRFVPDHFAVVSSALSSACGPGGFSYMGQPFTLGFTVEPRNQRDNATANYVDGFARASVQLVAENNDDGVDRASRLSGATGSWSGGTFSLNSTTAALARAGSPDGPFNDLRLGITLSDNDGGTSPLTGLDMNASTSGDCVAADNCTAKALNASGTKLRYGRLTLDPAHGSELLPLSLSLRAEYFNGAGWAPNTLDVCTTYAAADDSTKDAYRLSCTDPLPADGLACAALTPSGSGTLLSGLGAGLTLSAPGVPGLLRYDMTAPAWLGPTPSANVSFGIYRGNDRVIYQREVWR